MLIFEVTRYVGPKIIDADVSMFKMKEPDTILSRDARKPVFGFPTRSDTNRP